MLDEKCNKRAHTLTFQACVAPSATLREVVAKLSDLFVETAKSDRIRELLKSQSVDEWPIPANASAALYRGEGPI